MAEEHDINDAPPSYHEVISSPNELPPVVEPSSPRPHGRLQETRFTDTNRTTSRGTLPPPINASSTLPVVSTDSGGRLSVMQRFTSFNSIRYMTDHWGIVGLSDLDVEHHIPSSRRAFNASNQTSCSRIYCYRITLILLSVLLIGFAIVLPVVMVLAGALQFDECPFMNRALLYCVVCGGIALGLLTCLRFSICCIYYVGSDNDKRTNSCSNCLCCLELGFLLLGIGYLSTLVIAAYLTFTDAPDYSCPDGNPDCDDYCDRNVYQLLTVLLWIQFSLMILFVLTFIVLLMGVRWCCCVPQQTVRIS